MNQCPRCGLKVGEKVRISKKGSPNIFSEGVIIDILENGVGYECSLNLKITRKVITYARWLCLCDEGNRISETRRITTKLDLFGDCP